MTQAPKRIGIGGIAIESSTFNPQPSHLSDFTLLRGDAIGVRYPFLPNWRWQNRGDLTWLPSFYARSLPGGPVERAAYERMKAELLEHVRAALPLDGFLFDVHGAMFVLGLNDAEADLAEAIRAVVGPHCVISASMDLHGNISARLVQAVDLFTAYRTAPHIDTLETRQKAVANLVRVLDENLNVCRAWVPIPVILPGERTSTEVEPGRAVYASIAESDPLPEVLDASLWVGYVWADEARSHATAVVTALATERGKAIAQREALRIADNYWLARRDFGFCAPTGDVDWCIAQALATEGNAIFISDSGDNPTAGGAGDVPTTIGRLLANESIASGAATVIYASIPDAEAARACYAAGVGQSVSLSLGGKLDPIHAQPELVQGTVVTLFANDAVGGDIAVVRCGGLHIIVTTRRKPYHIIKDFTNLGLHPIDYKITVVKIGYLEPELRETARAAFLALSNGAVNQAIPRLTYQHVARPIYPLDSSFEATLEAQVFA